MASIYNNIYTYLSSITDLTTLLSGDRIQWPDGEFTELNGIIYRMVNNPPLYGSLRKWELWRFYINNTDKVTCQKIADVLYDNLHDFSSQTANDFGGTDILYIYQQATTDPVRLDIEQSPTYQIIQEYRITKLVQGA